MGEFLKFSDLSHPSWSSKDVISTLTDAARLFIFVFSPKTRSLLAWSKNAENILGVKDFEIARNGDVFLRHVHSDDRYSLLNHVEESLHQNGELHAVYRWIRPDNQLLCWLLCRAHPVEREGEIVYEGIIADISKEIKLVGGNSSSLFPVFDQLSELVIILSPDLHILHFNNPAHFTPFGYGDPSFTRDALAIGKPFLSCFRSGEARERMRELLSHNDSHTESKEIIIPEGDKLFTVEAHALQDHSHSGNILLLAKDSTRIQKLEKESADFKRASNFVEIAAGMSHNVNNTLQTIMGHAAAIKAHSNDGSFVDLSCSEIMKLVEQTSEFTHQLLSFKDSLSGETHAEIDLNVAVIGALEKLKDLLSGGVKVAVSFGTVPMIVGKLAPLTSAIETLIRQAHAIFPNSRTLSVQTHSRATRKSDKANLDQKYVKLVIAESGAGAKSQAGMPSALLRDLRNPATGTPFTSAVAELSRQGASIEFESTPSGGSCFAIYFKLAESARASLSELRKAPSREVKSDTTKRGGHRILVVDDEPLVLGTVAAILKESGYEVLTAETRKEALKIFKKSPATIHLVVIDALMPDGHGSELLTQLRRIQPDLLALGFSGASGAETEPLIEAGAAEVLRKPVKPERLLEAVRSAIAKKLAANS